MGMKFISGGVLALAMATTISGTASADVSVTIDESASYSQALRCYRFYNVTQQVADAFAAQEADGSEAKKQLMRESMAANVLGMVWNKHVDDTKGRKSDNKVDADLEEIGAPIVEDANAGLGGDAEAEGRFEAVQAECKPFEMASEG